MKSSLIQQKRQHLPSNLHQGNNALLLNLARAAARTLASLSLALCVTQLNAQDTIVAGANVNMVSGTEFPGGDPFLQRQNEPSLAVSTRNPLHLLAGANDYRTVDVPGLTEGKAVGDSWHGVFTSINGGWQLGKHTHSRLRAGQ
jgi:hypothetical protein